MCEIDPLKKAKYTIRQYTEDEKLRMIAEAREEQLRSEKSAMSFWKKEGRAEGRNETMYSVILAMKKNGLDAEQIARLTGFNADDVRASYDTVK